MKSGNLNLLETSGPLQACNGTALPLLLLLLLLLLLTFKKGIYNYTPETNNVPWVYIDAAVL